MPRPSSVCFRIVVAVVEAAGVVDDEQRLAAVEVHGAAGVPAVPSCPRRPSSRRRPWCRRGPPCVVPAAPSSRPRRRSSPRGPPCCRPRPSCRRRRRACRAGGARSSRRRPSCPRRRSSPRRPSYLRRPWCPPRRRRRCSPRPGRRCYRRFPAWVRPSPRRHTPAEATAPRVPGNGERHPSCRRECPQPFGAAHAARTVCAHVRGR